MGANRPTGIDGTCLATHSGISCGSGMGGAAFRAEISLSIDALGSALILAIEADLGSVQATLQQGPKILKPVRVNIALHVGFRVVNHLMGEIFRESIVGFQRIAVQVRSDFHVLTYQRLQPLLATIPHHPSVNLAPTL